MGTPFISFLEPSKLDGYDKTKPHDQQGSHIPRVFVDVMELREGLWSKEQRQSFENQIDADDARSCHWVVYASVNETVEPEVRDEDGNVMRPRKSCTRNTPAGAIRLVPFPHGPLPKAGGRYDNGQLIDEKDGKPSEASSTGSAASMDRPTTFYDGREPYVKLGRLIVAKEFRGFGLSGLLVHTVLSWLKAKPAFFDPSITELGFEQIGASNETEMAKWGGLICVHAAENAAGSWKKWLFDLDPEMGKWWDNGVPTVALFKRLQLKDDREEEEKEKEQEKGKEKEEEEKGKGKMKEKVGD